MKAWEDYKGDFNNMTDAEIETECEISRDIVSEHESWLEAVAAWEAAGRPRSLPVPDDIPLSSLIG